MPTKEKRKSKRYLGYICFFLSIFLFATAIYMYAQTCGTYLLYMEVRIGRLCKYYWIVLLIAIVFAVLTRRILRKNPKEAEKKISVQSFSEKNITQIKTEEKENMAFFEDFGKKISQAGQATLQKTKEMADIAKVNSAISDEEKKINDLYLQIGKLYVELHVADAEDSFKSAIEEIANAIKRIEEYKKQLLEIKGVARCSKCGAEVPVGSVFCAVCGAQIQADKAEPTVVTTLTDNSDDMKKEVVAEENVKTEE